MLSDIPSPSAKKITPQHNFLFLFPFDQPGALSPAFEGSAPLSESNPLLRACALLPPRVSCCFTVFVQLPLFSCRSPFCPLATARQLQENALRAASWSHIYIHTQHTHTYAGPARRRGWHGPLPRADGLVTTAPLSPTHLPPARQTAPTELPSAAKRTKNMLSALFFALSCLHFLFQCEPFPFPGQPTTALAFFCCFPECLSYHQAKSAANKKR